jgi:hypothetical protein
MPSGHEAFGLLHYDTFKKGMQLLVGLPPLWSRRFGLCPKEDCHGGNILARPSKERWIIAAIIVVDAAVDVASSTSSRVTIVATLELLLECHAQLRQSLLLLLKLSLKLPELSSWGCDYPTGGGMAASPARMAL